MRFSECEALLSTAPLTIETGVERLSSGGLHVAVLSLLENCTGAMLEHWFGMDCNTDEYRLWHPGAHLHSEWVKREECKGGWNCSRKNTSCHGNCRGNGNGRYAGLY